MLRRDGGLSVARRAAPRSPTSSPPPSQPLPGVLRPWLASSSPPRPPPGTSSRSCPACSRSSGAGTTSTCASASSCSPSRATPASTPRPPTPPSTRSRSTTTRAGRDTDKLRKGIHQLLARGPLERADLERAIAEVDPDLIIIDTNSYGAAVAAQALGPPVGDRAAVAAAAARQGHPALRPRHGADARPARRACATAALEARRAPVRKAMLPQLNALRAEAGLPALTLADRPRARARPADHPHRRPARVPPHRHARERPLRRRPAVGPARRTAPAWLDEPGDPWVLVTCSTDYQADEQLARAAVEALRDEPVRVLLTLADAYDNVTLPPAGNVRVERFVPHGAGARARRRRRLPQRHGHRAEGARRRRADRRRAVRARPARGRAPGRRGRRGRPAAARRPDAGAPARHGARGARDARRARRPRALGCAPRAAASASPTPPRSSCRTGWWRQPSSDARVGDRLGRWTIASSGTRASGCPPSPSAR